MLFVLFSFILSPSGAIPCQNQNKTEIVNQRQRIGSMPSSRVARQQEQNARINVALTCTLHCFRRAISYHDSKICFSLAISHARQDFRLHHVRNRFHRQDSARDEIWCLKMIAAVRKIFAVPFHETSSVRSQETNIFP